VSEVVEAVFEDGVFRPLEEVHFPEGQRVSLSILPNVLSRQEAEEQLHAWKQVYAGLSPEEIREVEESALDRNRPSIFLDGGP